MALALTDTERKKHCIREVEGRALMQDAAEESINERTRTAPGACRFDERTLLDLFMMLDKPFGLEYTGINSFNQRMLGKQGF